MTGRSLFRCWLAWSIVGSGAAAHADYLDDIGYRALVAQQNGNVPLGANIRIDQIEASVGPDPKSPIYRADPSNTAFSGVTSIDQTAGANPLFSSHATGVAALFTGNNSMTSGVQTINN